MKAIIEDEPLAAPSLFRAALPPSWRQPWWSCDGGLGGGVPSHGFSEINNRNNFTTTEMSAINHKTQFTDFSSSLLIASNSLFLVSSF